MFVLGLVVCGCVGFIWVFGRFVLDGFTGFSFVLRAFVFFGVRRGFAFLSRRFAFFEWLCDVSSWVCWSSFYLFFGFVGNICCVRVWREERSCWS